MFVHRVHVLNVQILAPSNRIPDCTFISVGVNSCTKSMVMVSVLFVQTFAPPSRRGECLYNEHAYVNHALCTNIRPSWNIETRNAILSGNSEVCTRIHPFCMWFEFSVEAFICMQNWLLFIQIFAPPVFHSFSRATWCYKSRLFNSRLYNSKTLQPQDFATPSCFNPKTLKPQIFTTPDFKTLEVTNPAVKTSDFDKTCLFN